MRTSIMNNTIEVSVYEENSTIKSNNSILKKAIISAKQTERQTIKLLLSNLTDNALNGTIKWSHNVTVTINNAIDEIDKQISKQLSIIMHNEIFKTLEGSWRGLKYLTKNSELNNKLRIKLLDLSKKELFKDLDKAGEFDQSQFFKKTYESEFGMAGGTPYSAMVADYEFSNHPNDISLLNHIASVGAAAFCPVISAANHKLFGVNNWAELTKPRDLENIFEGVEYTKWRNFRDNPDSRFITLTLPRVLARLPYSSENNPAAGFNYDECSSKTLPHEQYCWMNAAYVLAERMTNSFTKFGWCTTIRGTEGGGKVQDLPMHVYKADGGDIDYKCPTEIGITDRREKELSKLGFLPLCHYKNTDYAVFFGSETTHNAKKYDKPEASANASISARLPYIMATSRFAHYLKIIARDKVGSFMERQDIEAWLNRWILQYVNGNARSKQDLKAKYPLADAKICVQEVPGRPGSYQAIAWLRPWLQLEELTTSLRLVAKIPDKGH